VYGGRHNEQVFNDFWVYNIDTNHWYNWTNDLSTGSSYPSGRYTGLLLKTAQGMILYSGAFTNQTDLAVTDLTTQDYMNYIADCEDTLKLYGIQISQIGTPAFASAQAKLFASTNSSCFNKTTPLPTFSPNILYLQGLWFFNLTHCAADCGGNGFCEYGTCYCSSDFFGPVCEHAACVGTFCIYDSEFFAGAQCFHCNGNGDCVNGTCTCTGGYTGADCSMLDCQGNCSFNGDCTSFYPLSQCDCYGKYAGDMCEVLMCLNDCNPPYGSCNTTTGLCDCIPDYYGVDCSVAGFSSSRFLVSTTAGIFLAGVL
jgi:hypothetical protein